VNFERIQPTHIRREGFGMRSGEKKVESFDEPLKRLNFEKVQIAANKKIFMAIIELLIIVIVTAFSV
jgi:hypothetical protein